MRYVPTWLISLSGLCVFSGLPAYAQNKAACELVSKADAEGILGVTLLPPKPSEPFRSLLDPDFTNGTADQGCEFTNFRFNYATPNQPKPPKVVSVRLEVRYAATPNTRAVDEARKQVDMRTRDHPTDLSGLGDAAFWIGAPNNVTLFVFLGGTTRLMLGPSEIGLEQEKALATKALATLGKTISFIYGAQPTGLKKPVLAKLGANPSGVEQLKQTLTAKADAGDAKAQFALGLNLSVNHRGADQRATENLACITRVRKEAARLEIAGLWGFKADAIRKYSESQGLKIRSFHMGFDQMIQFMAPGETAVVNAQDAMYTPQAIPQLARINAPVARDLGCEWGVLASSGVSNFKTVDSVKRLCDSFNVANDVTKKAGLKFAYHMHAIDFEPVQGKMPFEMMLDQTDPDMRYQLDVCWAQAGGSTPADLVRKHASKIVSFHLKDLDRNKMVATPGDGVVDFAAIHKAASTIQDPIFFVERDGLNGRGPVVEATRAYKYLQNLGWGKA